MNSAETTKPIAPPACCSASVSPRCGRGMPLAMWTRPSTPNSSAAQPMTCRPAGPLLSGLRRLRQATKHSSSGTNQPSRPTEPSTTVRVTSPTPPGSCHQTAAATTTASADQEQPGPVAAVLGVELAGGVPDPADAGAEHVRDAEPDRGQPAPEGEPDARQWGRCRCGPLAARGASTSQSTRPLRRGLARDWLPDDRAAEPDAFEPAVQPASRCPCSATPEGKTYGSPCSESTVPHQSHASHAGSGRPNLGGARAPADHR